MILFKLIPDYRDAWEILESKDHSNKIQILIRKTRSMCSMYGQYRAGSEVGDNIVLRRQYANQALIWAEEIMLKAPKLPHGYRYKGFYLTKINLY